MITGELDNTIFANFVSKLGLGALLQGFILLVNFHFRKFINDLQESVHFIIIFNLLLLSLNNWFLEL